MKKITLLFTLGLLLSCGIFAQNWSQIQKLGAVDQEPADNLGISMAISDSFMFVGAWWEDGDMPGLPSITSAGAAYIYKLQPDGTWKETQKLVSPKRESLGYFGFSVAIEGNVALVGAFNEDVETTTGTAGNGGRVYAYERTPAGVWTFNDTMLVREARNGDEFGKSIALTEGYALIGADNHDFDENGEDSLQNAGAAFLFKRNPNKKWSLVTKLVPNDRAAGDHFGKYVDIDRLGLVIGAHDADLGISALGAGTAYGAYCNDSLLIWGYDNLSSNDLQKISISDPGNFEAFGWDVAVSGKWAVIGKSGENDPPPGGSGRGNGAAYFFHWENGAWVEKQKVYASDYKSSGDFGRSIDIDGKVCVIGAGTASTDANHANTVFGAGAAHVFELQSNGKWIEVEKLAGTGRAPNDLFGEAVAVWENHIAVGAWLADTLPNDTAPDLGAIYTYRRSHPLALDNVPEWSTIRIKNHPAQNGILEIRHGEPSPVSVSVRVFSLSGKSLFFEEVLLENTWQTDLSHLASGLYVVEVRREGFVPRSWKWIR